MHFFSIERISCFVNKSIDQIRYEAFSLSLSFASILGFVFILINKTIFIITADYQHESVKLAGLMIIFDFHWFGTDSAEFRRRQIPINQITKS